MIASGEPVAKSGDSAGSSSPFFFHCYTIRAGCHQFKQVQDHTLKITCLISPFLVRGGRTGGFGYHMLGSLPFPIVLSTAGIVCGSAAASVVVVLHIFRCHKHSPFEQEQLLFPCSTHFSDCLPFGCSTVAFRAGGSAAFFIRMNEDEKEDK